MLITATFALFKFKTLERLVNKPVKYRGCQIGTIENFKIEDDTVVIIASIYPEASECLKELCYTQHKYNVKTYELEKVKYKGA